MTDILVRLRSLAAHRAVMVDKDPNELIEWQAAEEIERLRGLVECCKGDRDRFAKLLESYKRGIDKATSWRKKS